MKNKIFEGDAQRVLSGLPNAIANTCVTSPPYYGLRDYGHEEQIGFEETPEEYIEKLLLVFREVKRVLCDDGTLWINIADSYAGSGKGAWRDKKQPKESYVPEPGGKESLMPKTWEGIKQKDLIGIPWMLAFALRADGWYLRQEIIWHKTNGMPESVADRCTNTTESMFLLSKQPQYYFDNNAIKEPTNTFDRYVRNREKGRLNRIKGKTEVTGLTRNDYHFRNKRNVWRVPTKGFSGAHFATFPPELIEPCIKAGSETGGLVLDPFFGSGTTGVVALQNNRNYLGVELNPEYCELARKRIKATEGRIKQEGLQQTLY